MALPQPKPVYPLGPYSLLLDPSGRYYFPSSFISNFLIPGTVSRNMITGEEDDTVWERLGDKKRIPEVLTIKGDLFAHSSVNGLRADGQLLRRSVQAATALLIDKGDGASRKISLDGGEVVITIKSEYHHHAVITLYPTSETVGSEVTTNVPIVRNRITTGGVNRITTAGRDRIAIALEPTDSADGTLYTADETSVTADYTGG